MPDPEFSPPSDGAAGASVDRRTLLLGAAGALAAAGLAGPARAGASATAVAARPDPRFDPALARRLQRVLRAAVRDPSMHAAGAILHVHSPQLGAWTGVAGLGRVTPATPTRASDRFRAGSIIKPFVAVVVLQLAERGRLSLDARLPDVLPAAVAGRFPTAPDVTVRMLLDHHSGIAEWDLPAIDERVARNPAKIWTIAEKLDLAAGQPPLFAPGTQFFYSNTDYTLLGLIIKHITGRSWRHEVTRRVIRPLRLTHTSLPAPGHRSISSPHMHGYRVVDAKTTDVTGIDPSIAGAAGGSALVTTVGDLARFLDALLKGRLFRHRQTLRQMLSLGPAQGVGGLVAYGLGIEQRDLPGGVSLIGHLGGTGGFFSYVGRARPLGVTIAFVINSEGDPTPLLLPAVHVLAAAHR